MKTDRFRLRAFTALLLAGLMLLSGGFPVAGRELRVRSLKISWESRSKELSAALAAQMGEVQQRFGVNRKALRTVAVPKAAPAYARQEVAALIAGTGQDLDQAILKIGEPDLDALRAWSAEEIRNLQEQLAALPVRNASLSTPRAVAVVASLGERLPLLLAAARPPAKAAPKPTAPKEQTVPADATDRLLDQVGAVVGRLFLLAKTNDLEVKLWVGSTPAPKATFRFWPKGSVKGSDPKVAIVQTAGKRDHVLRGLYSYRASWGRGAVTQLIEYPNPAGSSVAGMASEQLDLVKGTRFFCCKFNQSYCGHVDDEKECR
jgi:hypothetical protein